MHHRFTPKEHHFQHNIFMFYLDLDELNDLERQLPLFSREKFNLYSFRNSDHVPRGATDRPVKTKLIEYLAQSGIPFDARGRIMLLTLPRVLGYVFNPVSFYFCFDPAGAPVCAVAEVGNTFGEMKLFLLRGEERDATGQFRKIVPKHFYVSPFSELELNFDFKLRIPGEKLDVHVDDCDGEQKVLVSTLLGARLPLTSGRLAWLTMKCPLVTLKVIFLIHWHAFRLWLKRIPFHRKAVNPALQMDVLRPHPTHNGRPK